MPVTFRAAALDDVDLLTRWDSQPHVVAATGADDDQDWAVAINSRDDATWHLIAELDGRPIGLVQIIDPAREVTHYWGDVPPNLRAIDIWIGEESDLGHGWGTQMMRLALQRCFSSPEVTAVLIDPLATNTRAIRFYRRCGFREVGPRRFGEDDCLVMRIDRRQWQAATA
ncbi:MAG: GNAT family N-acetyltransferase [Candidatus Nanopelagicales bacterium]